MMKSVKFYKVRNTFVILKTMITDRIVLITIWKKSDILENIESTDSV